MSPYGYGDRHAYVVRQQKPDSDRLSVQDPRQGPCSAADRKFSPECPEESTVRRSSVTTGRSAPSSEMLYRERDRISAAAGQGRARGRSMIAPFGTGRTNNSNTPLSTAYGAGHLSVLVFANSTPLKVQSRAFSKMACTLST